MALGTTLGLAACQPESITAARDQLARGGARTLQIQVPITVDSLLIDEFIPDDVDTVIDGVFGATLDQQAFVIPVVDSFLVPIEFTPLDVDFGDFEDAIRDATINSAKAQIVLTNDSAQAITLANYTIGVTRLNPDGSVPLDAGGVPVYDTTATGVPRVITIADSPGDTILTVAANTTDTVEVDAGAIVDGVVHLVLDSVRTAVVVTGSGSGGGFPFAIMPARMQLVVLIDLTLPSQGIEFATDTTLDGAELSAEDAQQIADRVVVSSITASIVNSAPFGVEVDIAFVAGEVPGDEVFTAPNAVILSPITVAGSTVGTDGIVSAAATDAVEIALTGPQTQPLLTDRFTSRTRIRLVAGQGSNGRAVVRPGDVVVFDARAAITIQAGSDQ